MRGSKKIDGVAIFKNYDKDKQGVFISSLREA